MRSVLLTSLVALVAGGCSPAKQNAASPPGAPPAGVQWTATVLYNQPKDTTAFEKYYAEKHGPLVAARAQEIGFTRAEFVRFAPSSDGKPAAFYRQADLRWATKEARDKGMASEGFKAVAGDIANFATGGFIVLLGTKTN